jgi:hypothetical protein
MFSKSGLAPNCIVILAVESTGLTFLRSDSINRAFYHREGADGAGPEVSAWRVDNLYSRHGAAWARVAITTTNGAFDLSTIDTYAGWDTCYATAANPANHISLATVFDHPDGGGYVNSHVSLTGVNGLLGAASAVPEPQPSWTVG